MHPDWVLYKCDQKTPALQYTDKNIPVDITNAEVVNWQLNTYVQPASEAGYDALAVDNIDMENLFGACGHFDKHGQWIQLYSGNNNDPRWQADMLNWISHMQVALHSLPRPLLLIANFSAGVVSTSSDASQKVLSYADGALDESGFTHYGGHIVAGSEWLHLVQYVNSMQAQNKPFFMVNQVRKELTADATQWIFGSFLMCNQRLASINISGFKAYGYSKDFPELSMQIGSPKGEMYTSQGAYWRDFIGGEVIVNPSNNAAPITLSGTATYVDPYGKPVPPAFTLPPLSAKILLRT